MVKFLSWEILHPQQVTIKVQEAQGKKARAREDNCDWFLSSINTKFHLRFLLFVIGRYVTSYHLIFELFFCKKIPLSRRVEYVMDGSTDQ